MRQLVCLGIQKIFVTNSHAPFHLWRWGNLLKQRVPKYDDSCRCFFSYNMFFFFFWQRPKSKEKLKSSLKIVFRKSVSKNEVPRNIRRSMNIVLDTNKLFWSQHWLSFHTWFIITLYYKMQQILLQNASAILLQNTANVYCKMRWDFY